MLKRKVVVGVFVAAMALTGLGLRVAYSLHLLDNITLADPILTPITPPPY